MDDIARSASPSRALLYVYFKDKAAIQRACAESGRKPVARFREALEGVKRGWPDSGHGRGVLPFLPGSTGLLQCPDQASTAIAEADEDQARAIVGQE